MWFVIIILHTCRCVDPTLAQTLPDRFGLDLHMTFILGHKNV